MKPIDHTPYRTDSLKTKVAALLCLAVVVCHAAFGTEAGKHCLWSLKTADNVIYLLGSVHVLTAKSYPLPDVIDKAYHESDIIAFETELAAMNDISFQSKLMTIGLYDNGGTLDQHISEKTFNLLKKKVSDSGFPIELFLYFKPWTCALTLTTMELARLGFDPKLGVDFHYYRKALDDGKQTFGLESAESHLNLLKDLDDKTGAAFLEQTIQELNMLESMAAELITYWRTGNTEKLAVLLTDSFKDQPALYEKWVLQRNANWIPPIIAMFEAKKNVLIIVGAGHLIGEGNVLDLLAKQGYQAQQL